ncbi:uncharacterized protein V1518DRAFT_242927 [Limtongia smithiae]|uniref:uncharacterized protein n=1 Tax=Limtongia smithiae TaxID=1125753 RepID=UPI0034CDBC84
MKQTKPDMTQVDSLRSCLPSDNIVLQYSEPSKGQHGTWKIVAFEFLQLVLIVGAILLYSRRVSTIPAITTTVDTTTEDVPLDLPSDASDREVVTVYAPVDEEKVKAIAAASSAATIELSNALLKQLQIGLQANHREIELIKGKILEVAQAAKSDSRNLQGRLNRGGDVRRELEKLKEALGRLWQAFYQIPQMTQILPMGPPPDLMAATYSNTAGYEHPGYEPTANPPIQNAEFCYTQEQQSYIAQNQSKCVLTIDGVQFDLATEDGRDRWNTYLTSRNSGTSSDLDGAYLAHRYPLVSGGGSGVDSKLDTGAVIKNTSSFQRAVSADDSKYYEIVLSDKSDDSITDVNQENWKPTLIVDTTTAHADELKQQPLSAAVAESEALPPMTSGGKLNITAAVLEQVKMKKTDTQSSVVSEITSPTECRMLSPADAGKVFLTSTIAAQRMRELQADDSLSLTSPAPSTSSSSASPVSADTLLTLQTSGPKSALSTASVATTASSSPQSPNGKEQLFKRPNMRPGNTNQSVFRNLKTNTVSTPSNLRNNNNNNGRTHFGGTITANSGYAYRKPFHNNNLKNGAGLTSQQQKVVAVGNTVSSPSTTTGSELSV